MHRFSSAAMIVSALLSCAAASAEPAQIQVQGMAPTSSGGYQLTAAVVSFADLDVTTHEGAAALLARIDNAAQRVCARGPVVPLHMADKVSKCRKDAIGEAVASTRAPLVVQVAAAR